MRILLINLPKEAEIMNLGVNKYPLTDFLCHGVTDILSIASALNKNEHEVKVLDVVTREMNIKDVIRYILQYNPDVLGVSVLTKRLYACKAILKAVKYFRPKLKTVVFGRHLHFFKEETQEWGLADCILDEFYEKGFLDIVSNLEGVGGGCLKDDSCLPDRSLVDVEDYRDIVSDDTTTAISFLSKNTEQVIEELGEASRVGIREFFICDYVSGDSRDKIVGICNWIIKNKLKIKWSARFKPYPFDRGLADLMKRAGCIRLLTDISSVVLKSEKRESDNDKIDYFFILCKEYKIETALNVVVGCPLDVDNNQERLLNRIRELRPTYLNFKIFHPLPKTKYYNKILEEGIIKNDFWLNFARKPVRNFRIPFPCGEETQKELEGKIKKWEDNYRHSPEYVFSKAIKTILSPRVFRLKVRNTLNTLLKR